MKTKLVCVIALVAMVVGAVSISDAAIRRVPARFNLLNFYGGYTNPFGQYDALGPVPITDDMGRQIKVDADQLFDGSYYFGLDYGSIVNRYFQIMVGFRFTNNKVQDYVHQQAVEQWGTDFTYRTYDVNFEMNFYPIDLSQNVFSPYAGAGMQAGLVVYKEEGYDADSKMKISGNLNFGGDLKIYQAPNKRSFVTLASTNSYNFAATENRPKYLYIGGALRYWFR